MDNLLETLLFAFVVFINFAELNAVKPRARPAWKFKYDGHDVCVWNTEYLRPSHIELQDGNLDLSPSQLRQYHAETFLDFKAGLYFFVTTIKHENQDEVVKIENAVGYNIAAHTRPDEGADMYYHLFNRSVSVFTDQHKRIIGMRFTDINICPSEEDCRKYQISPKPFVLHDLHIVLKYYELRSGHIMGVELASNNA